MDVAQDVVITEEDCGTSAGLLTTAIIEGGDIVEALGDRVLGRTVAQDVYASDGKTVVIERGTLIDEAWVEKLDSVAPSGLPAGGLNELGIDRKMLTSSVICVVGQTLEKNYEGDERSGIFEIIDMNLSLIHI